MADDDCIFSECPFCLALRSGGSLLDIGKFSGRAMQMMMCEYSFRVGGFVFSVSLPEAVALERLLPSFLPFLVE